MRSAYRITGASLTVCAVLCALLLVLTVSASAKEVRIFSGVFGANGATEPKDPYPLAEPAGVAVDQSSHDIYVADPVNHRVEEFDAAGDFVLMFGKAVNKTEVEAAGSEAQQNLCTAASGDACQPGAAASTPGAFQSSSSLFLAVDNSTGPSAGDVYVGDPEAELVQKFDSGGALISSWGTGGQLNGSSVTSPPAPKPGPLGPINGVAVDSAGNLWVYGTFIAGVRKGRMFEFSQDASGLITDWNSEQVAAGDNGIALDAEDDVYLTGTGTTYKYTAAGKEIGTVHAGSEGLTVGLAADSLSSDLYLAIRPFKGESPPTNLIQQYDSSCQPAKGRCTPAEVFGVSKAFKLGPSEKASGVAIDASTPADTVYAADRASGQVASFSLAVVPDVLTLKASSLTQTSAMLNGSVNPAGVALNEGLEGCRFEWGETTAYGHTLGCGKTSAQIGAGKSPVKVEAAISGLIAGHTYHFRLVAANANDVNTRVDEPSLGEDLAFGPPLIESASSSNVAATSATLEAEVNPQNAETQVQIEYGTDSSYGQLTAEVDVGAAGTVHSIAQHVQDLAPNTVYHYRVVARSVLGTVFGADHSLITQAAATLGLLDGRDWELVSPADKHGALLYPLGGSLASLGAAIQASAEGGAITYVADAPTEAQPEGYANGVQVLSTRGASGWSSKDINTPHEAGTRASVTQGEEYRYFSSDLSLGIVQPMGTFTPSLSGEGTEQTAYLRSDYPSGDPQALCTSSCYTPLATAANTPEGTKFGQPCPRENEGSAFFCGPLFVGATSDLSHVVLASKVALTEGVSGSGLYEWAAGQLHFVGVLPNGTAAGNSEFPKNTRNAISADGSRIVWMDESTHRLYLRENVEQKQSAISGGQCTEAEKACTVELDEAQAGAPGASGGGQFVGASADDAKLFFTDASRLTVGAKGGDLYEYDVEKPAGQRLVDLSASGSEAAEVLGVPALSEDGQSVYFVATGALSGSEANARGETAQAGQPNLYLSRGGALKLVAVLSAEDKPDWNTDVRELTARISPNGQWLAFMSQRSLSGYDNRDAVSGKADEEVFLYDAGANGGEGQLDCASCNPSGGRPHGVEYGNPQDHKHLLSGGDRIWESTTWLAANIPTWNPYGASTVYQSRYLSDSGRLFFNAHDSLSANDTNGNEDVYELELAGSGSCTTSASTYAATNGGCVALISSGSAEGESAFLDASENGDDVFFLTAARLSGKDVENALDVYDAHACSAGSPCPPLPPAPAPACEGDSCQSPGLTPNDPTPSSLSFQGPGNVIPVAAAVVQHPKSAEQVREEKLAKALKACKHKRQRKQRLACERTARRKLRMLPIRQRVR
jgi:hypothetical protein